MTKPRYASFEQLPDGANAQDYLRCNTCERLVNRLHIHEHNQWHDSQPEPKMIRGAALCTRDDEEDPRCDCCGEQPHSMEWVRLVGDRVCNEPDLPITVLWLCPPCARLAGATVRRGQD